MTTNDIALVTGARGGIGRGLSKRERCCASILKAVFGPCRLGSRR